MIRSNPASTFTFIHLTNLRKNNLITIFKTFFGTDTSKAEI